MTDYILAIETSCDETAAAVYSQKNGMLSNVLYSQISLHQEFGGVIPEVASRAHLAKINHIVSQALTTANLTLDDISTIAVTNKPGLPGSLLVGVSFAKALAFARNKKLIGVNHLEGHVFSACIENHVPFEHLCLTASGGHTSLYLVRNYGEYEAISQTRDDAAGEAFDKIAKLINLPYPGGPVIEKLAQEAGFKDYFKYPRGSTMQDFSFSGLKTAVMYDLVKRGAYDMTSKTFLKDNDLELKKQVASSLLVAVGDIFKNKIAQAMQLYPHVKAITFVGGVACNKYLKNLLADYCAKRGLQFFTPSAQYCTDNAAMIAFVGGYKAQKSEFATLELDILK